MPHFTNTFPTPKKIGILGGGQLGKMLAAAAHNLGHSVHIFTNNPKDPALHVTPYFTVADYNNFSALLTFAEQTDLITLEFENIPLSVLEFVEQHTKVFPDKKIIKFAQNRILEKQFMHNLGIEVAPYLILNSLEDIPLLATFPCIVKTATLGYDGKGQFLLQKKTDINSLNFQTFPYIVENYIDFTKELSIIVARDSYNRIEFFPLAENTHSEGILKTSKVPALVSEDIVEKAQEIARKIVESAQLIGIMAIEFFLCKNNTLLVNEVAPRPHNSGHWSLEACNISQFEQTIRAIIGWPLKKVELLLPCITQNIIGFDLQNYLKFLKQDKYKVYFYGKEKVIANRKLGHINILLD